MAAHNLDGWHLKQAVGRGRHSVANTVSHGEQPKAKPDTQPNLCIFYRFGTVHCGDHCVICVEMGTELHMLEFLTEQDYDLLWVNGQSYSYTDGPDGVEAEGQIEWTSDTQGTEKGWSMCADAPTPSPTSPISVAWMCDADDRCVSSPNFQENYGTSFFCSITFDVDATLHVVEFETELFYDAVEFEIELS